ncbi:MAG: hypothetical protein JWM41_1902 [Gemmatimonadetes bacterium]|nr:hypothetical protein [Gemmatimonadota bacterium]
MRKFATALVGVGAAIALGACSDPLNVSNQNSPDVTRAFATPAGIEQLISTSFQQENNEWTGLSGSGALVPITMSWSGETYGTVANYGMNGVASIPRPSAPNDRGNGNVDLYRDFRDFQKFARSSANGIAALDRLTAAAGTLGSAGRDAKSRAFGFFTLGLALGSTALTYDSAGVVYPATPSDQVPKLVGYQDVMTAALGDLDSAIAIANSAAARGDAAGFRIVDWIRGNTLTSDDFIKVVRSYKARFRAGVARTPADRAAVNWDLVIADATAGITSDLLVTTSNGAGWTEGWLASAYRYQGWGATPPMYTGMADTSGSFDAWLATGLNDRKPFLIKTPDKRWPAGETRAAQQTASGTLPTAGVPYFRNRPTGEDTDGAPYQNSFYDHYRFRSLVLNNADRAGTWPTFTVAENDMLAAEGYIRKGQIAQAATLIDKTRVKAGLPALSGKVATVTDVVPGGTACVPRVPVAPFTKTACGTIMEALKYEKRLESSQTGYNQWWIDSRGWGDLVEGTPLMFPLPYSEADARQTPAYTLGGLGAPASAAKGTYGY